MSRGSAGEAGSPNTKRGFRSFRNFFLMNQDGESSPEQHGQRVSHYEAADEDEEEEQTSDDFDGIEEQWVTPESLKHPDNFKDQDADDDDYLPSESEEEEEDEEEEEEEEEQDMGNISTNDAQAGGQSSGAYEYRGSQMEIPVLDSVCLYATEAHEGSCMVVCTNFDNFVLEKDRPGLLADFTAYNIQQQMSPHGFPLLSLSLNDGSICAWIPPNDKCYSLLEKHILSYHQISARVSWSHASRVPGHGLQYVGSCAWAAVCEEGDGLDNFHKDATPSEASSPIREITPDRSSLHREPTSSISRMIEREGL
ncbi:hypothetical protein BJ508DRAFT_335603 [Ascobolus immersus RN42]|uniref:Uncharacterized protein n=1 Tax=Ascobolus immersus RN42 TaxID=1160509 RepID=A0A3N4HBT6_ASCIM|nr:hypothetical protein BJ508DRAFT_335603 [Ascobolus immersus RN42]